MPNSIQVAISLVGVVISLVALLRTRVSTEKQRKLQVAAHIQAYFKGLHEWADEVVTELTNAAFLCELDPKRMKDGEFFDRRQVARARLSALLDQGKLFIPNSNEELVGVWKESAYRGLRQPTLDWIERAYALTESLNYTDCNPNQPKRKEIIDAKRAFVSEVQEALNVRHTSNLVRLLAREIQAS